jgi:hypothetical protein
MIYVLYKDNQVPLWQRYMDTWQEGMAERDPSIIGPDGLWQQPRRGFGHLWRTTTTARRPSARWSTPYPARTSWPQGRPCPTRV